MPLVKSFEEACEFKGVDPVAAIPDLSAYPEDLRNPALAALKLFIINDAINDSIPFDWNNGDQYKYFAWWDLEVWDSNPGGFRFGGSGYAGDNSYVGSRLCFHSRDQLKHSVETFPELWQAVIKG